MRTLPLALLLIFSGDALHAQSEALPADILQGSYSRLPLVKRADLDESGKRSPQLAEPMHAINLSATRLPAVATSS